MFKSFDRGAKTAPSHYPRIPFHVFRFFQLVSSIVVGAIMCYFMWHLNHEGHSPPWTFVWLTAASLASVAALTSTIFLHCLTGLRPSLNLAINALLLFLWLLSWALLTWFMRGTLIHKCDIGHWNEDVGIMVCRMYKALFAFTSIGLLSTVAALILDIYVRRKQMHRGAYQLHDVHGKAGSRAAEPFFDGHGYGSGGLTAPRESGIWEESRRSMGPYNEQADDIAHKDDYAHPHFGGDTGYHGVKS